MRRKPSAYDLELQRKHDAYMAQDFLCHDDCDRPTESRIIETCGCCQIKVQAKYMHPTHLTCRSCHEKGCHCE